MEKEFVSRLPLRRLFAAASPSPSFDQQEQQQASSSETATDSYKTTFKYEKNVCALSWWEPIKLLEEGSISDIHLVRRRDHFVKVRYKDKRDVMSLAKKKQTPWSKLATSMSRHNATNEHGNNTTSNDDDGEVYVLKSIMKDYVGHESVLYEMRREIQTMSKLHHPNICRLIEAYERRRHIYLVMEYCSGGNLARRVPVEEEGVAAMICKKILLAVEYMHSKGVAHRDIKLENIMLDGNGEIKLIDFGLATAYLSDEYNNMTDKVGTLYSMAPEV
jgi:serine/threonine protein kinase